MSFAVQPSFDTPAIHFRPTIHETTQSSNYLLSLLTHIEYVNGLFLQPTTTPPVFPTHSPTSHTPTDHYNLNKRQKTVSQPCSPQLSLPYPPIYTLPITAPNTPQYQFTLTPPHHQNQEYLQHYTSLLRHQLKLPPQLPKTSPPTPNPLHNQPPNITLQHLLNLDKKLVHQLASLHSSRKFLKTPYIASPLALNGDNVPSHHNNIVHYNDLLDYPHTNERTGQLSPTHHIPHPHPSLRFLLPSLSHLSPDQQRAATAFHDYSQNYQNTASLRSIPYQNPLHTHIYNAHLLSQQLLLPPHPQPSTLQNSQNHPKSPQTSVSPLISPPYTPFHPVIDATVIVAGAGSGKTQCISARAAYFATNLYPTASQTYPSSTPLTIPPSPSYANSTSTTHPQLQQSHKITQSPLHDQPGGITCLAFNRDAAASMRERIFLSLCDQFYYNVSSFQNVDLTQSMCITYFNSLKVVQEWLGVRNANVFFSGSLFQDYIETHTNMDLAFSQYETQLAEMMKQQQNGKVSQSSQSSSNSSSTSSTSGFNSNNSTHQVTPWNRLVKLRCEARREVILELYYKHVVCNVPFTSQPVSTATTATTAPPAFDNFSSTAPISSNLTSTSTTMTAPTPTRLPPSFPPLSQFYTHRLQEKIDCERFLFESWLYTQGMCENEPDWKSYPTFSKYKLELETRCAYGLQSDATGVGTGLGHVDDDFGDGYTIRSVDVDLYAEDQAVLDMLDRDENEQAQQLSSSSSSSSTTTKQTSTNSVNLPKASKNDPFGEQEHLPAPKYSRTPQRLSQKTRTVAKAQSQLSATSKPLTSTHSTQTISSKAPPAYPDHSPAHPRKLKTKTDFTHLLQKYSNSRRYATGRFQDPNPSKFIPMSPDFGLETLIPAYNTHSLSILEHAASILATMRICTIHSYAYSVIRHHLYQSPRYKMDLKLLDDNEQAYVLFIRVICHFIRFKYRLFLSYLHGIKAVIQLYENDAETRAQQGALLRGRISASQGMTSQAVTATSAPFPAPSTPLPQQTTQQLQNQINLDAMEHYFASSPFHFDEIAVPQRPSSATATPAITTKDPFLVHKRPAQSPSESLKKQFISTLQAAMFPHLDPTITYTSVKHMQKSNAVGVEQFRLVPNINNKYLQPSPIQLPPNGAVNAANASTIVDLTAASMTTTMVDASARNQQSNQQNHHSKDQTQHHSQTADPFRILVKSTERPHDFAVVSSFQRHIELLDKITKPIESMGDHSNWMYIPSILQYTYTYYTDQGQHHQQAQNNSPTLTTVVSLDSEPHSPDASTLLPHTLSQKLNANGQSDISAVSQVPITPITFFYGILHTLEHELVESLYPDRSFSNFSRNIEPILPASSLTATTSNGTSFSTAALMMEKQASDALNAEGDLLMLDGLDALDAAQNDDDFEDEDDQDEIGDENGLDFPDLGSTKTCGNIKNARDLDSSKKGTQSREKHESSEKLQRRATSSNKLDKVDEAGEFDEYDRLLLSDPSSFDTASSNKPTKTKSTANHKTSLQAPPTTVHTLPSSLKPQLHQQRTAIGTTGANYNIPSQLSFIDTHFHHLNPLSNPYFTTIQQCYNLPALLTSTWTNVSTNDADVGHLNHHRELCPTPGSSSSRTTSGVLPGDINTSNLSAPLLPTGTFESSYHDISSRFPTCQIVSHDMKQRRCPLHPSGISFTAPQTKFRRSLRATMIAKHRMNNCTETNYYKSLFEAINVQYCITAQFKEVAWVRQNLVSEWDFVQHLALKCMRLLSEKKKSGEYYQRFPWNNPTDLVLNPLRTFYGQRAEMFHRGASAAQMTAPSAFDATNGFNRGVTQTQYSNQSNKGSTIAQPSSSSPPSAQLTQSDEDSTHMKLFPDYAVPKSNIDVIFALFNTASANDNKIQMNDFLPIAIPIIQHNNMAVPILRHQGELEVFFEQNRDTIEEHERQVAIQQAHEYGDTGDEFDGEEIDQQNFREANLDQGDAVNTFDDSTTVPTISTTAIATTPIPTTTAAAAATITISPINTASMNTNNNHPLPPPPPPPPSRKLTTLTAITGNFFQKQEEMKKKKQQQSAAKSSRQDTEINEQAILAEIYNKNRINTPMTDIDDSIGDLGQNPPPKGTKRSISYTSLQDTNKYPLSYRYAMWNEFGYLGSQQYDHTLSTFTKPSHIIIDEAQDLAQVDFELLCALSGHVHFHSEEDLPQCAQSIINYDNNNNNNNTKSKNTHSTTRSDSISSQSDSLDNDDRRIQIQDQKHDLFSRQYDLFSTNKSNPLRTYPPIVSKYLYYYYMKLRLAQQAAAAKSLPKPQHSFNDSENTNKYDVSPSLQRLLDSLPTLPWQSITLTLVGDDDQSIYSFKGATGKVFASILHCFPQTKFHSLNINYRSNQALVDLTSSIVQRNLSRLPKNIKSVHALPKIWLPDDVDSSGLSAEANQPLTSPSGSMDVAENIVPDLQRAHTHILITDGTKDVIGNEKQPNEHHQQHRTLVSQTTTLSLPPPLSQLSNECSISTPNMSISFAATTSTISSNEPHFATPIHSPSLSLIFTQSTERTGQEHRKTGTSELTPIDESVCGIEQTQPLVSVSTAAAAVSEQEIASIRPTTPTTTATSTATTTATTNAAENLHSGTVMISQSNSSPMNPPMPLNNPSTTVQLPRSLYQRKKQPQQQPHNNGPLPPPPAPPSVSTNQLQALKLTPAQTITPTTSSSIQHTASWSKNNKEYQEWLNNTTRTRNTLYQNYVKFVVGFVTKSFQRLANANEAETDLNSIHPQKKPQALRKSMQRNEVNKEGGQIWNENSNNPSRDFSFPLPISDPSKPLKSKPKPKSSISIEDDVFSADEYGYFSGDVIPSRTQSGRLSTSAPSSSPPSHFSNNLDTDNDVDLDIRDEMDHDSADVIPSKFLHLDSIPSNHDEFFRILWVIEQLTAHHRTTGLAPPTIALLCRTNSICSLFRDFLKADKTRLANFTTPSARKLNQTARVSVAILSESKVRAQDKLHKKDQTQHSFHADQVVQMMCQVPIAKQLVGLGSQQHQNDSHFDQSFNAIAIPGRPALDSMNRCGNSMGDDGVQAVYSTPHKNRNQHQHLSSPSQSTLSRQVGESTTANSLKTPSNRHNNLHPTHTPLRSTINLRTTISSPFKHTPIGPAGVRQRTNRKTIASSRMSVNSTTSSLSQTPSHLPNPRQLAAEINAAVAHVYSTASFPNNPNIFDMLRTLSAGHSHSNHTQSHNLFSTPSAISSNKQFDTAFSSPFDASFRSSGDPNRTIDGVTSFNTSFNHPTLDLNATTRSAKSTNPNRLSSSQTFTTPQPANSRRLSANSGISSLDAATRKQPKQPQPLTTPGVHNSTSTFSSPLSPDHTASVTSSGDNQGMSLKREEIWSNAQLPATAKTIEPEVFSLHPTYSQLFQHIFSQNSHLLGVGGHSDPDLLPSTNSTTNPPHSTSPPLLPIQLTKPSTQMPPASSLLPLALQLPHYSSLSAKQPVDFNSSNSDLLQYPIPTNTPTTTTTTTTKNSNATLETPPTDAQPQTPVHHHHHHHVLPTPLLSSFATHSTDIAQVSLSTFAFQALVYSISWFSLLREGGETFSDFRPLFNISPDSYYLFQHTQFQQDRHLLQQAYKIADLLPVQSNIDHHHQAKSQRLQHARDVRELDQNKVRSAEIALSNIHQSPTMPLFRSFLCFLDYSTQLTQHVSALVPRCNSLDPNSPGRTSREKQELIENIISHFKTTFGETHDLTVNQISEVFFQLQKLSCIPSMGQFIAELESTHSLTSSTSISTSTSTGTSKNNQLTANPKIQSLLKKRNRPQTANSISLISLNPTHNVFLLEKQHAVVLATQSKVFGIYFTNAGLIRKYYRQSLGSASTRPDDPSTLGLVSTTIRNFLMSPAIHLQHSHRVSSSTYPDAILSLYTTLSNPHPQTTTQDSESTHLALQTILSAHLTSLTTTLHTALFPIYTCLTAQILWSILTAQYFTPFPITPLHRSQAFSFLSQHSSPLHESLSSTLICGNLAPNTPIPPLFSLDLFSNIPQTPISAHILTSLQSITATTATTTTSPTTSEIMEKQLMTQFIALRNAEFTSLLSKLPHLHFHHWCEAFGGVHSDSRLVLQHPDLVKLQHSQNSDENLTLGQIKTIEHDEQRADGVRTHTISDSLRDPLLNWTLKHFSTISSISPHCTLSQPPFPSQPSEFVANLNNIIYEGIQTMISTEIHQSRTIFPQSTDIDALSQFSPHPRFNQPSLQEQQAFFSQLLKQHDIECQQLFSVLHHTINTTLTTLLPSIHQALLLQLQSVQALISQHIFAPLSQDILSHLSDRFLEHTSNISSQQADSQPLKQSIYKKTGQKATKAPIDPPSTPSQQSLSSFSNLVFDSFIQQFETRDIYGLYDKTVANTATWFQTLFSSTQHVFDHLDVLHGASFQPLSTTQQYSHTVVPNPRFNDRCSQVSAHTSQQMSTRAVTQDIGQTTALSNIAPPKFAPFHRTDHHTDYITHYSGFFELLNLQHKLPFLSSFPDSKSAFSANSPLSCLFPHSPDKSHHIQPYIIMPFANGAAMSITPNQAFIPSPLLPQLHANSLLNSAFDFHSFQPSVCVTTVHKSKGLEFDYILLPSTNPTQYPIQHSCELHPVLDYSHVSNQLVQPQRNQSERSNQQTCPTCEEELRLFYVALTRAKKSIFVTYPTTNMGPLDLDKLAKPQAKRRVPSSSSKNRQANQPTKDIGGDDQDLLESGLRLDQLENSKHGVAAANKPFAPSKFVQLLELWLLFHDSSTYREKGHKDLINLLTFVDEMSREQPVSKTSTPNCSDHHINPSQ